MDERHARRVARELGTEPTEVPLRVRLLDAKGAAISEGGEPIDIGLGPLERRPFQLMIELDDELRPGRSAGLEVTLRDGRDEDRVVGSLGVALLAPDRR